MMIIRSKFILLVVLFFVFSINISYATTFPGDSVKVKKERVFEVFNTYGINSSYSEICPVIYNTELVFCSNREWNKNTFGESDWHETNHYNIFRSSINFTSIDSVEFDKIKVFNHFLISHLNVGPITFNGDYTEAIYVENEYVNKKRRNDQSLHVQLYSLKIESGKLKDKEKLSFCESKYNYSHPTLSSNGKVLVFTSNIPCGKKGLNLFYSERKEGFWSDPTPLKGLNSNENEAFPTIQGNDLYFSSDGYDAVGGYDLFVAHYDDSSSSIEDRWAKVINLGEEINSDKDDFGIVFNPNGSTGYFVSNRDDTSTTGNINDDIFSFEVIEKAIFQKDFQDVSGKFEYYRLNGKVDNMEVLLLDENGNIFAVTTTDDHGNFNFDYIPAGKKYTIKLNEEGEVILTLFEEGDNTILMTNDYGEFIFKKLAMSEVGTMALIDEGDVNFDFGTYDFKGQLEYQTLDGSMNNMTVYLVDDAGNIVFQTKTDEYGNFIFEKLPYGSNYMIKVEEKEDMVLKIYNNVDHIMATLTKDASGNFIYRLLNYENTTNLSLISGEGIDLHFAEEKMMILGFFKHIDGIYDRISFEVLDMEGNVLLQSQTDENGSFKIENLPLLEDLIFRIDKNSPYFNQDLKINIVTRDNDVLVTLDKDEFGMYRFKRLVSSKYNITETEDLNDDDFVLADEVQKIRIENYVIYYPPDIFTINSSYYGVLDSMIITLNDFPESKIQIDAHASSTAAAYHNMKLSIKRMNKVLDYLVNKGVSKSRMSFKAYGESKLLNRCGDDVKCEDEMHQINRRTELKIIHEN